MTSSVTVRSTTGDYVRLSVAFAEKASAIKGRQADIAFKSEDLNELLNGGLQPL